MEINFEDSKMFLNLLMGSIDLSGLTSKDSTSCCILEHSFAKERLQKIVDIGQYLLDNCYEFDSTKLSKSV